MSPVSRPLSFTLKAWPIIALATIGLCYLTQAIAKLFGIDLPDQANIELVRRVFTRAFEQGWRFYTSKIFWSAVLLTFQVIILMPVIEEFLFRYLLFKLPVRLTSNRKWGSGFQAAFQKLAPWAIISSILFSAAHYLFQPWPDAAFLALFFFGLAQCWLYQKTDRIWCAMLNHALFNLTNLVLLFILPSTP